MFKLGGHRPDPAKQYQAFDKKELFRNSAPLYSGEPDLRPFSSPRHNQTTTDSCVAQSVIKALEIKRIQKYGHGKHVDLSVMDLYYGCRDRMDPRETNKDDGTYIYLACQVLKDFGVCREVMHPFRMENLYVPPPILATREARMNQIKTAYKINSGGFDRVEDVVANLEMGNPVVFGTAVGKNWLDYSDDSEPLRPTKWEETKGNHAVCIVGYVDNKFIIENSWGTRWGDNGYGWLRPEVIADSASKDFWVICDGSEVYAENIKDTWKI